MISERFRTSSCVDGVVAMPHRLDAVDMAVRESTRLVTLSFDTGVIQDLLQLLRGGRGAGSIEDSRGVIRIFVRNHREHLDGCGYRIDL